MSSRGPLSEQPAGFEPVDHTADVGLRVWASNLEELFVQAARGLASMLTVPARVARREGFLLEVQGLDLEELLVGWLNEILYRFESDRLLLVDFEDLRIARDEDQYRLEAVGLGETWVAEQHPAGVAVKSATYHNLSVVPNAHGRYEVTLIFDT